MKKEIIRVEPLATYLERWKAPTSTVVKHGNTLYVTGAPPYEPETGEIFGGDIRRQAELVLEQLKACVEAGGSSLENVLQCTVYSTSQEYFAQSMRSTSNISRRTGRHACFFACNPLPGASTSK
jgi:2-iminobutanoate/2-iminopropanoate deaminase